MYVLKSLSRPGIFLCLLGLQEYVKLFAEEFMGYWLWVKSDMALLW